MSPLFVAALPTHTSQLLHSLCRLERCERCAGSWDTIILKDSSPPLTSQNPARSANRILVRERSQLTAKAKQNGPRKSRGRREAEQAKRARRSEAEQSGPKEIERTRGSGAGQAKRSRRSEAEQSRRNEADEARPKEIERTRGSGAGQAKRSRRGEAEHSRRNEADEARRSRAGRRKARGRGAAEQSKRTNRNNRRQWRSNQELDCFCISAINRSAMGLTWANVRPSAG